MLCVSDGRHCLRCARNAWQKLGNMNPEEAMERYVALLSDRVPDWKEENYHVSLHFLRHCEIMISCFPPWRCCLDCSTDMPLFMQVNDKLESEETVKPDAVAPSDTASFTGDQTDYTHERWSVDGFIGQYKLINSSQFWMRFCALAFGFSYTLFGNLQEPGIAVWQ